MPVKITSRYHGLPVYTVDTDDGPRPTLPARQAPEPAGPGEYRHRVAALEDLEYLAWRYFGRSEDWWRIADANPLRFPLDLHPGDAVAVPTGADPGLVVRGRRF